MNDDNLKEETNMKDLSNYVIPYPYAGYELFERYRFNSFDEFKRTIFDWVHQNKASEPISRYYISNIFTDIMNPRLKDNKKVLHGMFAHREKIFEFKDFSGIGFGIIIDEKLETVRFSVPHPSEEDKELYPGYDFAKFDKMSITDKLKWFNDHCEFIPIIIYYENFEDGDSHKYSHIKKNLGYLGLVEYISQAKFKPSDNVYYFIRHDHKGNIWLQRDLEKSPRRTK